MEDKRKRDMEIDREITMQMIGTLVILGSVAICVGLGLSLGAGIGWGLFGVLCILYATVVAKKYHKKEEENK